MSQPSSARQPKATFEGSAKSSGWNHAPYEPAQSSVHQQGGPRPQSKRDRWGRRTRLACSVAEFARIRAIRGPVAGPPEVLATSATSETCVSPHWHAKQVRVVSTPPRPVQAGTQDRFRRALGRVETTRPIRLDHHMHTCTTNGADTPRHFALSGEWVAFGDSAGEARRSRGMASPEADPECRSRSGSGEPIPREFTCN